MTEKDKIIEKENPIMLEFGKWTSKKDIEDLKILLEDIREKYHFRWFVHTYYNETKALQSQNQKIIEEIEKIDFEKYIGEYCFKARTLKQELLNSLGEKE